MQRSLRTLALASAATMALTFTPLASAEPTSTPEPSSPPTSLPAPQPGDPTPTVGTSAGDSASLEQALKRDLGMSLGQFKRAGAKSDVATAIQTALAKDAGFERVTMDAASGALTVVGTGPTVAAVAKRYGATVSTAGMEPPIQSAHQLREAYLKAVGGAGLVSVTETAKGYAIGVVDPQAKGTTMSAAAFARRYRHVTVVKTRQFSPLAETLTNGQGISMEMPSKPGYIGLCSVGFGGFTNTGARTVITAGHCSEGLGTRVWARDIVSEEAMGGAGHSSYHPQLGTVAWAEFGSSAGYVTTDFATIENITADYVLNPGVLKWQASGTTNPSSNQVQVTGVTTATIGAPVCRSGRTTGWHCGKIDELGVVNVEGRYIDSLVSWDLISDHGDSGGSAIVGHKAVGVLSAGATAQAADGTYHQLSTMSLLKSVTDPATNTRMRSLEDARPGYQPKIYMQVPSVPSTGWFNKAVIRGTLPPLAGDSIQAGTVVRVIEKGVTVATAPVAANGAFSFTWNGAPGTHTVQLVGAWGYSTSAARTLTITTPSPIFGDQNADGIADVLTVQNDGSLRVTYMNASQQPISRAVTATTGWGGYDYLQLIADVNGDGWTDALVRRADNRYLYIRYGQGFGRFGGEVLSSTITTRWVPVSVMPDVDGDGQTEFLGRDGTILQRFQVQRGTGKIVGGAISSRQWLVTGQSVSMGDHSGDGYSDLMHVADSTHNFLRTQFGPTGAIIGSRSVGAGWYPRWLSSPGDMTRDGRRDMLMLRRDGRLFFYGNITNNWNNMHEISGVWTDVKQIL